MVKAKRVIFKILNQSEPQSQDGLVSQAVSMKVAMKIVLPKERETMPLLGILNVALPARNRPVVSKVLKRSTMKREYQSVLEMNVKVVSSVVPGKMIKQTKKT